MHGRPRSSKPYNSQQRWGPWSEWKWSAQHHEYFSERFDEQGNAECRWRNSQVQTGTEHQSTPRIEAPIEQLTTDFGNSSLNSAGYGHGYGVQYPNQSYLATTLASDPPASSEYTTDPPRGTRHGNSHSHRNSDKGKTHEVYHSSYVGHTHGRHESLPLTTNTIAQYGPCSYTNQTLGQDSHHRATAIPFEMSSSGDTHKILSYQPNTDFQLERALELSRNELLGNTQSGEASNPGVQYDNAMSMYTGAYAPNPRDGSQFTQSRVDFTNTMLGAPENMVLGHKADKRFVVEHSNKFQPGEVFKILWSEPTGQLASDSPISERRTMNGPQGHFYVGYRRFIIVTTDESHHSTCVPISTYDRRGCSKRGVRPDKHGIIHTLNSKPQLLRDEPKLGFPPIPLRIYAVGETLARESRVNYSKLVTIEHNFPVFFIGRIPAGYFESVAKAVDQCWSDKLHKKTRR